MADHFVAARLHIVEMLESLLSDGRTVMLSQVDGVYEADCSAGRHAVEVRRRGRNSSATSLEGAIEGLTDAPREKCCAACGQTKRLWAFGPDKDAADGHTAACKACEAKRIGEITRRKKTQPGDSP